MTTELRSWPPPADLPALESGDRLTREEFHSRYKARPDISKAELVRGVVYVPSPTRAPEHGDLHGLLVEEFGFYRRSQLGILSTNNGTLLLDDGSELQPDIMLRYSVKRGGASRVDAGHYVTGAPELVAEIAASSASYDLHDKKEAYRQAGIREYIVWRVNDEAIDWWHLDDREYVPIRPADDGRSHSIVFPGLSLDLPGLLDAARLIREDELGTS